MENGERGDAGHMRSMTGQEVADMFGDKRLLALEAEHKQFENTLHELSQKLTVARENPESDWEDVHALEEEFQATLVKMRKHDLSIRTLGMDYGKKRGTVLH